MNRFNTGFFRVKSLSHILHHHEGRAVTHNVFSQASGTGGSNFIVDVEPTSYDWGVANAAWEFATPATGRATTGDVTFTVEDE